MDTANFFHTARERERIRRRRSAGMPWPWTDDEVLRTWSFCNVRREDDRTTRWFREHIRSKVPAEGVVLATMAFRWFNRIETAELIEDLLLGQWDTQEARRRLVGCRPVVTGAYVVKTPNGLSKLDGVLWCIDRAAASIPRLAQAWGRSLELAWADLCTVPYLGPFMAYEVVSDLRWTPVLGQATDLMTWANPGPGCLRGLRCVEPAAASDLTVTPKGRALAIRCMQELLEESLLEWPYEPAWEMREVEHWCCEYAKYCAATSGRSLKRRYDPKRTR